MAFENRVRVDQHFIRARLLEDGETIEARLFLTPELAEGGDVADGFTVEVSGEPVVISAGEIDDEEPLVRLTITPTVGGVPVTLSYDEESGSITGGGFPLVSFTDRAVANLSEYTDVVPQSNEYPLDDDGTIAAMFGYAAAPASGDDLQTVAYTYQDPATGNAAIAIRGDAFDTGSIEIDGVMAIELLFNSVPAGDFGNIGIGGIACADGSPVLSELISYVVTRQSGTVTISGDQGVSGNTSTPLAGFRIGLEFNGDDGTVTFRTTDGLLGSTPLPEFTPGNRMAIVINITDNSSAPGGQTISVTLVTKAEDMQLAYTPGATDIGRNAL